MHSGFLGSFLLVCCIVEKPILEFIHQSELSTRHLFFTFENTRVATLRGMCFMDTIQRSQKFKKAQRLVGIEPTNHSISRQELHCCALNFGFVETEHSFSTTPLLLVVLCSKNSINYLGVLRFKPGATGSEAQMLPLCYSAHLLRLKLNFDSFSKFHR